MSTHISHSLEETATIAHDWIEQIKNAPNKEGATLIGLSGNLGAGKTAFTKAVAKEFGIQEDVTSPTFVIMKLYPIDAGKNFPWKKLVHIDAYRLEHGEELGALKFDEIARDSNNIILIEWPENVKDVLGKYKYAQVDFSVGDGEMERVIVV